MEKSLKVAVLNLDVDLIIKTDSILFLFYEAVYVESQQLLSDLIMQVRMQVFNLLS